MLAPAIICVTPVPPPVIPETDTPFSNKIPALTFIRALFE